ncbi:MAG: prepilin-type N-terminal cleavage/methylation domain-containing protein [Solirubrobacteraceae bacterium]
MPATTHIRGGEDGFTLVELLVAMTISLIVLFATLQSLDAFTSNAAHQTRVTDANDQVRSAMDRTVADLRGASAIVKAIGSDLVYAVPATSTTTTIKRLCVASGELYGSSSTVTGTPTEPPAACETGTRLASLRAGANTAFTYDGASSVALADLPRVKNVGLKLSLDTSGGGRTGRSTLEASAARRSAATLPITDADLNTGCESPGVALLSLDAGIPNVAGLSVTYKLDDATLGVAVGSATVPITVPSGVTTILATVTDALGVTTTFQKDISCP